MGAIQSNRKPSYDASGDGNILSSNDFYSIGSVKRVLIIAYVFVTVDFDHFQILRAIGRGAFGKVNRRSFNFTFIRFIPCVLIKHRHMILIGVGYFFFFSAFEGLHRSEEGHKGDVCNEIHEQKCLH